MRKNILQSRAGMTFVETLMAVSIFALGVGGFTLLFSKTWQSNAYTLELGRDSMAASLGLNKIVDYIRRARQGDDGSYPIKLANNNEMTFFCDYDKSGDSTERLHIYKSNGNIMMGITEPTATLPKTYPSADQTTVVLASHVINDDSDSIFQYFNNGYPADTTNNPLATPAAVANVRLVRVYLEVNIDLSHAPNNVHMQSFVEMRNLNDYNQAQ